MSPYTLGRGMVRAEKRASRSLLRSIIISLFKPLLPCQVEATQCCKPSGSVSGAAERTHKAAGCMSPALLYSERKEEGKMHLCAEKSGKKVKIFGGKFWRASEFGCSHVHDNDAAILPEPLALTAFRPRLFCLGG